MFRTAILIASDKGSRGERQDISGDVIAEFIREMGFEQCERTIVPDDRETISKTLVRLADEVQCDLILTSGGTGFSPRDWTPEATLDIVHRPVPGIPEALRAAGLKKTNRAMLSRAVAGIRGNTLIINLPGSPKAVAENLEELKDVLTHGLEILTGKTGECARKE